jgi:prophage maintenance system killer protein
VINHVDVAWLLSIAEREIQGNPRPDDVGPLYAAVARHQAAEGNHEVYPGVWLKTAALLETLVRLPALPYSNDRFGWLVARSFLHLNGHQLVYPGKEAAELVTALREGDTSMDEVAARLELWSRFA